MRWASVELSCVCERERNAHHSHRINLPINRDNNRQGIKGPILLPSGFFVNASIFPEVNCVVESPTPTFLAAVINNIQGRGKDLKSVVPFRTILSWYFMWICSNFFSPNHNLIFCSSIMGRWYKVPGTLPTMWHNSHLTFILYPLLQLQWDTDYGAVTLIHCLLAWQPTASLHYRAAT